jgi:GMP synthase-like glutamine amidotransferase
MQIGILQTGDTPDELRERYPDYAGMFGALLQAADPAFTVRNWNINGAMDIPASPGDADGWIITGSRHGVYEDHPWIEPLKAFLREAHGAEAPMVGICFGHQILAEALGGKVVKSDKGWGCGVHSYTVRDRKPWMEDAATTLSIQAMHQDQVVEVPPGAQVFMDSPFCPNAGIAYGDTAISVQPHPEFDAAFERTVIENRRGAIIPENVADTALAGVDGPTDSAMFGRWMVRFFREAAARNKAA